MAVTTTVAPADIAVALGRTAPPDVTEAQWQTWIDDAVFLIEQRVATLGHTEQLDQAAIDYVVRHAVVAQVQRPDDSTSVDIAVDDGRVSKRYSTGSGRVSIRDEWWDILGLNPSAGAAYSVDTVGLAPNHSPWCDLMFLGPSCSCGANLTGGRYPLYYGDV